LATYIRLGRITKSRSLFVSVKPPHGPFQSAIVLNGILKEAYRKTGLKTPSRNVGSYVLRHSLATNLVRRGASLDEIANMLRHRPRAITMHYARDAAAEMIKLTTYLGHTNPANTYWYIQAVPELLELASQRAVKSLVKEERP